MSEWIGDVVARIEARKEAANLIIDQEMRAALWKLCMDPKQRNREAAMLAGDWLGDLDQDYADEIMGAA